MGFLFQLSVLLSLRKVGGCLFSSVGLPYDSILWVRRLSEYYLTTAGIIYFCFPPVIIFAVYHDRRSQFSMYVGSNFDRPLPFSVTLHVAQVLVPLVVDPIPYGGPGGWRHVWTNLMLGSNSPKFVTLQTLAKHVDSGDCPRRLLKEVRYGGPQRGPSMGSMSRSSGWPSPQSNQ